MSETKCNAEVFNLQLQIKNKQQEFDEAIKGDREFSLVKEIYLEIKELQKLLQKYTEDYSKQQRWFCQHRSRYIYKKITLLFHNG